MMRRLAIVGVLFALAATTSALVRGATPEEIQRAIESAKAELRPAPPPAPATGADSSPAPAQAIRQTPPAGVLNPDTLAADFQPTPMAGIGAALRALNPRGKVFLDIGCGFDCRASIVAVRDFGATRAIAIEIDPAIADSARRYVEHAGLAGRIQVITADAAVVEFPAGAVGFAYLWEDTLAALRTKIATLDRFASYAHKVTGLPMRQSGDVYLYERQPAVQQVTTQRVPIYATVQGRGVWNGRYATPKRGCNCSMCQSLRAQIASSSGRRVVGYRTVPVQQATAATTTAPAPQQQVRSGHYELRKVCINGRCSMVRTFVPD